MYKIVGAPGVAILPPLPHFEPGKTLTLVTSFITYRIGYSVAG